MVYTNPTIESKEEEPETSNSKKMEHTVDNRPEKNPSLSAKLPPDTLSEVEYQPESNMSWMIASVAFSLLTIYTMVQVISQRLAQEQEIENCHGTAGELFEHPKDIPIQTNNKKETAEKGLSAENVMPLEDSVLITEKENECNNSHTSAKKMDDLLSISQSDEQNLQESTSALCKTNQSIMNKTNNEVKELEVDGKSVHGDTECTKCKTNCHAVSLQMGPPFHGNLCIVSEVSDISEELAFPETLGTATGGSTTIDLEQNCLGAPLLENDSSDQVKTPVEVNCLKTKCITCNADKFRKDDTWLACCDESQNTVDGPQLSNTASSAKQLATSEKHDCSENQPPSTIHCVKTEVKSLSCDLPVANDTEKSLTGKSFKGATISSQDNYIAVENENNSKAKTELETAESSFLRYIRNDPVLSKSFDSQIEVLRKGCKLLEKKPSKSSLRCARSVGCLKKFVHFPEDIRNIRTVHKYHSFDEHWNDLDAKDTTKNEEQ